MLPQVEHLPVTVATHVEGKAWVYEASDKFIIKLRWNCAIFRPEGRLFLQFSDGDEYDWTMVGSYTHL